jgi:hypothetical protein
MNTKRRLLGVRAVLSSALVVIAACGFPDVMFDTQRDTNASLGGEADDGGSTEDVDAWSLKPVSPYVEDPYARRDGGDAVLDASVCAERAPCDCDDDGFADVACPVDPSTILSSRGQPLEPGDCDDLDPLRFPGQGFVGVPPIPGKSADWNCDGVEEHAHPTPIFCPGTPATGCSDDEGFSGFVACGAVSKLLRCGLAPIPDPETRPCAPRWSGDWVVEACR